MAFASNMTSSHSENDSIKAIRDPFGYGHEGRIGVDRETSARRKGIAAVLHQFAKRGLQAPDAAQYEYLITHGFYTVEELKEHPGRPAAKATPTQELLDPVEEERVAAALEEHIRKVDDAKYTRRRNRVNRWDYIREEVIMRQRMLQRKPAPQAVTWAFQEPTSGSESDEERAEVRESEVADGDGDLGRTARGGFGRGRGSGRGGRGRGRGGRGIGNDGDAFT